MSYGSGLGSGVRSSSPMSSSLTTMNDEAQGRLARAKQSFLRQPLEDGTTSASDTEGSGSQSDSYSG